MPDAAVIGPPAASGEGSKEQGPPGCCLFVYHIPVTWGDSDLSKTFAPLAPPGKLLSATVFKDKNTGISKGFGFVNYDNTMSANNAIAAMHGMQIEGKRLRVEIKKPKGASTGAGSAGVAAAVAAQHNQMQALAMQQLALQGWGGMMNPAFGQSNMGGAMAAAGMGGGFSGMSSSFGGMEGIHSHHNMQHATPAYDPYNQQYPNMNMPQDPSMAGLAGGFGQQAAAMGMGMGGMGMGAMGMPNYGVTAAASFGAIGTAGGGAKKTGPPNACLFIYHIPITWSDQDLAQCFAPFAPPGNLLNAMVYKDRSTGASKGFGFIDYDNPISAQNAINAMHGMSVDGKRLRVEIKKAKGATPY